MSESKKKKKGKAMMLGVGLDSDGHKRITTGENFLLVGGSKDTHEEMTEKVIKINEKLQKKGKTLDTVSKEEFDDIAHEVGLKRYNPHAN
jgi:BMFP domain-containing protein YqiC